MSSIHSRACPPGRRSFVQLWFAVLALMLLGFVGLAIDAGYMVFAGNQLQGAAEAAALAGAQELWRGDSAARDAAVAISPRNSAAGVPVTVGRNDANGAGGDVVLGFWDEAAQTFDPTSATHNACKVVARRDSTRNGQLSLSFGSAFGVPAMDMQRSAIAYSSAFDAGPALIVLDNGNTTNALDLTGGITVDIAGGPIHVNSHASSAARVTNNATLIYERMDICGGYTGSLTPTPHTRAAEVPDPLASLPEPSVAGRDVFLSPAGQAGSGETQNLSPGYYPDGWNVKGTLNLSPGVYCIGNFASNSDALSANSSGRINGTGGVMLYVRGNIGLASANVNLNLLPPDPTLNSFPEAETYNGVAMFQTRDRTHGVWLVKVTFGGSVTYHGVFYYPYGYATYTAGGTNDLSRMICWQLNGAGNGTLIIHWGGNQAPAPGPTYLVQ